MFQQDKLVELAQLDLLVALDQLAPLDPLDQQVLEAKMDSLGHQEHKAIKALKDQVDLLDHLVPLDQPDPQDQQDQEGRQVHQVSLGHQDNKVYLAPQVKEEILDSLDHLDQLDLVDLQDQLVNVEKLGREVTKVTGEILVPQEVWVLQDLQDQQEREDHLVLVVPLDQLDPQAPLER